MKKNQTKHKINRVYNTAFILLVIVAVNFISNKTALAATINVPTNFLTLNTGLVGWWTFDGKDTNWLTNTTTDRSGNGNTATMTNMSTSSSPTFGKTGQALLFDGSNDYVNGGNSASMNISGPFTVSAWIYESATNSQGVITKHTSSTATGTGFYVLASGGTSLSLRIFDGSGNVQTVTIGSISRNKWYFFTAYYDGSFINACLNGTCTTPVAVTGFTPASAQNLTIGAYSYTKTINYSGKIDDVRVYNRALSLTEIQQLYNATSGSRQDVSKAGSDNLKQGLVGWWTFDGKDTVWTSSSAATTLDKSGNGNTGTLTNMNQSTATVAGKVGQGLRFDINSQNYVNAQSASSLDNLGSSSPVTLSAWINAKNWGGGSFGNIMGKPGAGTGLTFQISNTNYLYFRVQYSTTPLVAYSVYNGFSTSDFNKWVHVVLTWDGTASASNVNFYKNGILLSHTPGLESNGVGNRSDDNTYNLGIGNNTYGTIQRNFGGVIDDVRIYNRALSTTEIQQLYNMGR